VDFSKYLHGSPAERESCIQYPDGEFRDVEPIPGAIVINAGDLLQLWSNNVIRSTHHRVVSPTNPSVAADGKYGERYSIAFFAHPDHDKTIDTLATCWDAKARPKMYGKTLPGEWIENRLKGTYAVY